MEQAQVARPNPIVGWITGTRDFLVAAQAELKKVTWPTRDELFKATRMIVILSVVLGVVIGLVDLLLNKIFVDGIAALAR